MEREQKTAKPKTIDQRFDEVSEAIAEQRDYTTFCFDKVRAELRREMRQVRQELHDVENRLTRRLDRHDVVLGEILGEVKALRQQEPSTN